MPKEKPVAGDKDGNTTPEEDGVQAKKEVVEENNESAKNKEGNAYESPRSKQITGDPSFKPGERHDIAEFERQIKGQQDGMNDLTVEDFLKNRDAYLKDGRSVEGSKAQKDFREKAQAEKIKEYRKEGMSYEEAEARDYMSDKAALHDPDQVAGGKGDNITGLGDSKVNSSIGRQWKDRIGKIDAQVREQAKNMTPQEMKNTKLNVHLYP